MKVPTRKCQLETSVRSRGHDAILRLYQSIKNFTISLSFPFYPTGLELVAASWWGEGWPEKGKGNPSISPRKDSSVGGKTGVVSWWDSRHIIPKYSTLTYFKLEEFEKTAEAGRSLGPFPYPSPLKLVIKSWGERCPALENPYLQRGGTLRRIQTHRPC